MSRKIQQRYLVGKGVAPADVYVWDLEHGRFKPNDLIFYDPITGVTLGAGDATYAKVPILGVAQAVDLDGDGFVDAIRKIAVDGINGAYLYNVTTDSPSMPVNQIKNLYFRCTEKDTDYTLNFEWRNEETLLRNLDNQWSSKTVTVNLGNLGCADCDTNEPCGEVACAFANQFYGKNIGEGDSMFLRRAVANANMFDGVDVMPILGKEVQYCISTFSGACGSCTEMDAISGIRIKADLTILNAAGIPVIPTDITIPFAGSLVTSSTTKSYLGQADRIIKLINKAFVDRGLTGHAVRIDGLAGTARPCEAFKILINSCFSVELLNGTGVAITPCTAEYNPYLGKSFTSNSQCVGCSPNKTFVPNCGVRVMGKPIKIDKNCLTPDRRVMWYHTEVDITTNEDSNFSGFYKETMQEVALPNNLGIQFYWKMLDALTTGTGFDYDPSLTDIRGLYSTNKAGKFQNIQGLSLTDMYRTIVFEHGMGWNTQFVNTSTNVAQMTTYLLISETDTTTKTTVKAILDPWLSSLPVPKPSINIVDDAQDQTPIIINNIGTVTQEADDSTGSRKK